MENIVYITGAGFSAPLGLPVMSNFIEKGKDIYAFNNSDKKFDYFQDVFDKIREFAYIKQFFNSDLTNIEELLSIVEVKNIFSKDKNSSNEKFKKFIIDTIEQYTPNLTVEINRGLDPLRMIHLIGENEKLLNLYAKFILNLYQMTIDYGQIYPDNPNYTRSFSKPTSNYNIITFNYDLVIENFINAVLAESKILNDQNTDDVLERVINEESRPIFLKNYSKLHGCISDNTIIPPSWNKIIQNKKIKEYWEKANYFLENANYIRILGYSLPDTDVYFKYLLKNAILHNEHLKQIDIICLDPTDEVKNRYSEFIDFKNTNIFNLRIEEYLFFLNKDYEYLVRMIPNSKSISYDQLEIRHSVFVKEYKNVKPN